MSQPDESFEIDTSQPPVTAVPTTDDASVQAEADQGLDEPEPDPRPLWDIEFSIADGGGVEERHADTAEEARANFLAEYPEDRQPTILSIEPS